MSNKKSVLPNVDQILTHTEITIQMLTIMYEALKLISFSQDLPAQATRTIAIDAVMSVNEIAGVEEEKK